jgi:hypothetical protein
VGGRSFSGSNRIGIIVKGYPLSFHSRLLNIGTRQWPTLKQAKGTGDSNPGDYYHSQKIKAGKDPWKKSW